MFYTKTNFIYFAMSFKISTNKTVNIFRQLSHDKSMEKTIQDVLQKRKVHKNISNKL